MSAMVRNSGREWRLARAALRLGNFTVSELESLTGANENTIYSFLSRLTRLDPAYLRSETLEREGRGRRANRYWLTKAGIGHLLEWSSEIAELFREPAEVSPALPPRRVSSGRGGGLKLILADSQAIFRAGIAKVLAVEDEMRILAQVQTIDQLMMAIDKFRAVVLIVPEAFHPDFAQLIEAARKGKTRVIVVSETPENAQRLIASGAHGVIYRSIRAEALVDCVRKVARGETWIEDVAVPTELTENDMVGLRVRERLTAKEVRIVALVVQGYKNKEIAQQLGTTEQVIKNYLRNVYDKIGVSDRLELALFTIHHGLLSNREQKAAAASNVLTPDVLFN